MSTAGMSISSIISKMHRKNNGFTLIELTIVVFIAGLFLSFTVPAIRDNILRDSLKTASRKLAATVTWLRNKSVSEYKDHILRFDLGTGRYWHETGGLEESDLLAIKDTAAALPEDVSIMDIDLYGYDKRIDGEAGIKFSRKGYLHYSLIHLRDKDGRVFTLVLEPFLGKVKIMEDYINFDEILSEDN